jgi:hypothetical protein
VRAIKPENPGRPDMIGGDAVRQLMADHHITQHKYAPHIHGGVPVHQEYSLTDHPPHEELHTSQTHLWKPALEKYIKEGHEHLMDPDHANEDRESDMPYHPQTYDHNGRTWIDEGHHRILARRMVGEDVTAFHGFTAGHDHDDDDWDTD